MNECVVGMYVSGIETYGDIQREMRGWIREINDDSVLIQADDSFKGHRGTYFKKDTVRPCKQIPNWQEALNREIPTGSVVQHFKGKKYKLLGYGFLADGGSCVIYMELYGNANVWVREKSEFMSVVDKEKYPDAVQTYRFEKV